MEGRLGFRVKAGVSYLWRGAPWQAVRSLLGSGRSEEEEGMEELEQQAGTGVGMWAQARFSP